LGKLGTFASSSVKIVKAKLTLNKIERMKKDFTCTAALLEKKKKKRREEKCEMKLDKIEMEENVMCLINWSEIFKWRKTRQI
jgi:hypothetical protein